MGKAYMLNKVRLFSWWQKCFDFIMENGDEFKIVFQDNPNDLSDDGEGLNVGKADFLNLESIRIEDNSSMMEDSFVVIGPLTDNAKKLFYHYIEPTFNNRDPQLWCFQIIKEGSQLLQLADFGSAFLFLSHNQNQIVELGIDCSQLESIDL